MKKLSELEAERSGLTSEVQSIDAQLSEKRKYDPDGTMWTVSRYYEWRSRAVTAKAHLMKKVRALDLQIKEARRLEHLPLESMDLRTVEGLLAGAGKVLRRIGSEFDLTEREQAVVDGIRHYLHHERPAAPTPIAQRSTGTAPHLDPSNVASAMYSIQAAEQRGALRPPTWEQLPAEQRASHVELVSKALALAALMGE